jgi:hypothetical protein
VIPQEDGDVLRMRRMMKVVSTVGHTYRDVDGADVSCSAPSNWYRFSVSYSVTVQSSAAS